LDDRVVPFQILGQRRPLIVVYLGTLRTNQ
jgi:hypothetical protein